LTQDESPGSQPPHPPHRTFSFGFSFGKKPEDGELRGLLDNAAEGVDLAEGVEVETDSETFKFEFADGRARFSRGEPTPESESEVQEEEAESADREHWERLERIAAGTGAFPDTARWYARLNLVVWLIVIALPIAAFTLTLVTGEDAQTVVVATFAAAFIGAMLRSSIR
jgi:hypothetical protein